MEHKTPPAPTSEKNKRRILPDQVNSGGESTVGGGGGGGSTGPRRIVPQPVDKQQNQSPPTQVATIHVPLVRSTKKKEPLLPPPSTTTTVGHSDNSGATPSTSIRPQNDNNNNTNNNQDKKRKAANSIIDDTNNNNNNSAESNKKNRTATTDPQPQIGGSRAGGAGIRSDRQRLREKKLRSQSSSSSSSSKNNNDNEVGRWNALADEYWEEIFSFLDTGFLLQTVRACCKQFYDVVYALLYTFCPTATWNKLYINDRFVQCMIAKALDPQRHPKVGLVNIELDTCDRITDVALRDIKHLTNIERLDISGCKQITDRGIVHLKSLTNLKTLLLGANGMFKLSRVNPGALADVLQHLSGSLESLDLTGIDTTLLFPSLSIGRNHDYISFEEGDGDGDDKGHHRLGDVSCFFARLPLLRELRISRLHRSQLKYLTRLEYLDLTGGFLEWKDDNDDDDDDHDDALGRRDKSFYASIAATLQVLYAPKYLFDYDREMIPSLINLRELYLEGCIIVDAERDLIGIKNLTKLTVLDLSDTAVTNTVLVEALKPVTTLEQLFLCNCEKIRAATLLADLPQFLLDHPHLQLLDLSGIHRTIEQQNALQEISHNLRRAKGGCRLVCPATDRCITEEEDQDEQDEGEDDGEEEEEESQDAVRRTRLDDNDEDNNNNNNSDGEDDYDYTDSFLTKGSDDEDEEEDDDDDDDEEEEEEEEQEDE